MFNYATGLARSDNHSASVISPALPITLITYNQLDNSHHIVVSSPAFEVYI